MKTRILSIVALVLITVTTSAQIAGLQVGYISADNVHKNSDNAVHNGFQVGVVTESNLIQNLDLHYGLLYNMLLENKSATVLGVESSVSYMGHLVDLPIQVQYGLPLIGSLKVFAFGGPTLNFSIDQSVKTTVGSAETIVKLHGDLNNDGKSDLSRFDVKLGVGGGLQFDNIQVRVGYDWGLLNLNTVSDNLPHHRNQLTAALVYSF